MGTLIRLASRRALTQIRHASRVRPGHPGITGAFARAYGAVDELGGRVVPADARDLVTAEPDNGDARPPTAEAACPVGDMIVDDGRAFADRACSTHHSL